MCVTSFPSDTEIPDDQAMKEAMFVEKRTDNRVRCYLCPHYCTIKMEERGKCGVRENRGGVLYSLVYEKASSTAIDPIEKKPLFHFIPGSLTFSVATLGCNMLCAFCQNWEIAHAPAMKQPVFGQILKPEAIVERALEEGCSSISYTYTEPTIFFEYAYDTARLAHKNGLKNVFVSNGFITEEAIDVISPFLDAVNIDLKGFSDEYYKNVCGARLEPILNAIRHYYRHGIWLELTTLIVPGHMDSEEKLKEIADFIYSLDPGVPWHISRFFPHYKMEHVAATDFSVIEKAVSIGKKRGLKYIYAGNVAGNPYQSTTCPHCERIVIDRQGYSIKSRNLKGNRCGFCHEKIDIIPDEQISTSLRS